MGPNGSGFQNAESKREMTRWCESKQEAEEETRASEWVQGQKSSSAKVAEPDSTLKISRSHKLSTADQSKKAHASGG